MIKESFSNEDKRCLDPTKLKVRGTQFVADAGVLFPQFRRWVVGRAAGCPQHIQRGAVGDAVEPRAFVVGAVAPQGATLLPCLDEGFLHGVLGVGFTPQQAGTVAQVKPSGVSSA